MKNKKNILVFIDWYLPGYKAGGPIRSCVNMVEHLSSDFNFWILTRDTDYCETQPYATIKSDTWITMPNNSKVYYISKGKLTIATIRSVINKQPFDGYYINGVFSFYFSIVPLFYLRKHSENLVIIAARGMLAKSALAIKKPKKQFFLAGARALGLFKKVIFHATNTIEAMDIRTVMGDGVAIRIAPNLAEYAAIPLLVEKEKPADGPLHIVNVARISPEKNLLYALQLLAEVKQYVVFDVYGPVYNQDYWNTCLAVVKKLPPNISFNYKGPLESEKVIPTLQQYHFLFMPTRGENFGHIILQALMASCPVIISDQTPWRNLAVNNTGWDIPLDTPRAFVKAIAEAASMSQDAFDKMTHAAHSKAVQIITDKSSIEQNKQLFLSY